MEDENSGKMLETQLTEETETKVEEKTETKVEETELEPTIENNDEKRFTEQAVSYTHLDVYKRQVIMLRMPGAASLMVPITRLRVA